MVEASRIDQLAKVGLLLFAFSIPWSSALYRVSMLLVLLALLGYVVSDLLVSRKSKHIFSLWNLPLEPVWLFACGLSTWVLLSYFWTSGKQEFFLFDAWRYMKLWMIPVFGYMIFKVFKDKPLILVKAFGLGCLVLMLPSFLDYFDISKSIDMDSYLKGNPAYSRDTILGLNLVYFRNHIVHGFHIALLFSFLIFLLPTQRHLKILYSFLAFCCIFDITHLIIGKMALFSLILSMLLVTAHTISDVKKKVFFVFCFLGFVLLLVLGTNTAPRLMLIWNEAYEYFIHHNINSSGGNRLHYWQISLRMFLENPLLGAGAGAFRSGLEASQDPLANNFHYHTHNEYLSQLSQFGLVGFALFLGLLFSLFRACILWRQQPLQACVLCVVLVFSLNALSDSSLHNEWEGWTLIFFSGLILSQNLLKKHPSDL